jgi:hypothetical protein
MKIKLITITILLFTLVGMTNCNSTKTAVEPTSESLGVKPNWVTNRPTDAGYYIGIGVASKTANPTTYSTVAQRNALNELASSIEVQVKSNSMLFSFEEQNQYQDDFKEFIQVKTNQEVENYDLIAAWENDYEYWVYYRLSIEQYKKDKQAKIDKATNMSINFLQQGQNEWVNGDYRQGMMHFFDALEPIKPFLGEPLPVTMHGTKEVFLGNYILSQISQGIREFLITPVNADLEVSWGGNISAKSLTFNVKDRDGKELGQIPVNFVYSEGIIRPRSGLSGVNGTVFTEIKKLTSTNNLQEVSAEIDFQSMILGKKRPDEIDKLIFAEISAPKTSIKIHVKAPSIYVYSSEKSLSKGKGSMLKLAFQDKALEMGFTIAKSKKSADLIAFIDSDTREAGKAYDLNNAYLNATIKVTDNATNSMVYQDKIENIKGVDATYVLASKEAYKKAVDRIIKKIVPRFYRKYTS